LAWDAPVTTDEVGVGSIALAVRQLAKLEAKREISVGLVDVAVVVHVTIPTFHSFHLIPFPFPW
jgi:hypothetical protein